jgi:hypothetical protein
MKCRAPTVVNLSKGASARVDADAITTPSVPRLAHVYSASDFLCLFGFAHFSGLNAVSMYLVALLDVALLIH